MKYEERLLGEDPVAAFQYLRGGYQEDRVRLFMKGHSRKIRDSGYKLKADGYIHTYIYTWSMAVMQWSRLPREVVQSPSMELFKS
ncbi:hypothetical protein QYF61_010625 [Mycteria americana]|uniref:Uncharacterized protein n=1 Tax=Mycteria americana TaxID=33587 RepID=A0AAN7S0T3_MYCAM|nr:hypothetical protein QYF61_010625 [Mycteria americana]